MATDYKQIVEDLIKSNDLSKEKLDALVNDRPNFVKLSAALKDNDVWNLTLRRASKFYHSITNRYFDEDGFIKKADLYGNWDTLRAKYAETTLDPEVKKIYEFIQKKVFDYADGVTIASTAISFEQWEKIVIKYWPLNAHHEYTTSVVEWSLETETLEAQAKNILDHAKQKEKQKIDNLYNKFLSSISTKTKARSETDEGSDTIFGFNEFTQKGLYEVDDEELEILIIEEENIELATERLYAYKAYNTPIVQNQTNIELEYIEIGYYAGLDNYGIAVIGDVGQTAEELQAQVADNAPPPKDDDEEKADYDIEEMYQYIDQCVLLSRIEDISTKKKDAENLKKYPYNLTTIKIHSEQPELVLNRFLIPGNLSTLFSLNKVPALSMGYYKIGNILSTNSDNKGKYNKIQLQRIFTDFSTDLNLKGTNPSTARSDIKLGITAKADSFSELIRANTNSEALYSLLERPGFIANKKGFNRWYKNQYHPSYYKKAIIYEFPVVGTNKEDPQSIYYGYDTTLVDHTLENNEEDGSFNLNLDSMAYNESLMNLPYLDALGSKEILDERRNNERLIEQATLENCSEDTIKELKRTIKQKNKGLTKDAKTKILKKLADLELLSTIDVNLEEVKDLYKNGIPSNSKKLKKSSNSIKIWGSGTNKNQEAPEEIKGKRTITFFTLSDLIMVLSEMFYKKPFKDTTVHNQEAVFYDTERFPGFEPQFLTIDFNYKQGTAGSKVKQINTGDIPIAVSYFSKFLNDQYYSKDMDYVPIGVFLRDIVEKAFTQLISEVCFSDELENKIHFKVSYFKGKADIKKIKNRKKVSNLVRKKFKNSLLPAPSKDKLFNLFDVNLIDQAPLFSYGKRKAGGLQDLTEEDLTDYIVIHAFTQTYTSKNIIDEVSDSITPYNVNGKQVNSSGTIPVIRSKRVIDGAFRSNLIVSSMKWKKVEGKYLREQRMFSSNNDFFLAIGNVYDCDIELNVVMPWFVPGQYIIVEPFTGDNLRWSDTDSTGYKLGMSGLYVIISVNHKTTNDDKNGTTTLNCQWVNSALGDDGLSRGSGQNKIDTKDVTEVCKEFAALDDQIIYQDLSSEQIQTRLENAKKKDNESGAEQETPVKEVPEPKGTALTNDAMDNLLKLDGYDVFSILDTQTLLDIYNNTKEGEKISSELIDQGMPPYTVLQKDKAVDKDNKKIEASNFKIKVPKQTEDSDGNIAYSETDFKEFTLSFSGAIWTIYGEEKTE